MTKLLGSGDFHQRLRAERAFLARRRHPSCLLVFDVGEREGAIPDTAQDPTDTAWDHRLREVDVVGWLGPKQIGVLLVGADREAANPIAERLAAETFPLAPAPTVMEFSAIPPARSRRRADSRRARPQASDAAPARVRNDPGGLVGLLARPLPRWKRAGDVVLAGTALLLFAPLLLAIAIAIKATSPGAVIYRQRRTGYRLRRFWIYKFRTMRSGSDRELAALQCLNEMSGPLFKSDADPRVTPLGRILRRTSLDELPQLVNVLRGDMTLLGPRALSPPPSAYRPWQLRRFAVTPGLACEWQAARRGETDFEAWMRSDLGYAEAGPRWTSDLRLLCRTAIAVLTCAGGR